MPSSSQARMAPTGEARASKAVIDVAQQMSLGGDLDDVVNLAVQMVAQEAKARGAEPAEVVLGIAKALGSVLALTGVGGDLDALLARFDLAARDYYAKSVGVLGRMGTEGSA